MRHAATETRCGGSADGEIGHGIGAGIASDNAAAIRTESDARKVGAGIDECEDGGADVKRDRAATEENLGVAVYADTCAARITGCAVVVKIVSAKQVALAVGVQVERGTGMAGNLDVVEEGDLAAEAHGDAYGSVVLDESLRAAVPEGDLCVFLERDTALLVSSDDIRPGDGAELSSCAAAKIHSKAGV